MALFEHICGTDNHKFEPRYDLKWPANILKAPMMFADELKAFKEEIYLGDVCIYCGKVVNEKKS